MARNSVKQIDVFKTDDTCGLDVIFRNAMYDDWINICIRYKKRSVRMELHSALGEIKTFFKTEEEVLVDVLGNRTTFVKLPDGTIAFPRQIL